VAFAALVSLAVVVQIRSILLSPRGQFPNAFPFVGAMELFVVAFALWIWSSGMFLNSLVPPPFKMKVIYFQVAVLFVPLYLPVFGVFFQTLTTTRNAKVVLFMFAVIFPLHLFAMFCQIYSWYFVSKNLAMAEKPQFAAFPNYVGYFFGLWFLPVGIWFIQPRINSLYAGTLDRQTA
jgi:hypothetical protein